MNKHHRLRRGFALAVVVSALAAPVASAATAEQLIPGASGGEPQNQPSVALSPPPVAPESSTIAGDGFDWGDAGIGATAMLALAAIAAGAAVAVGHRPRRGHTVA